MSAKSILNQIAHAQSGFKINGRKLVSVFKKAGAEIENMPDTQKGKSVVVSIDTGEKVISFSVLFNSHVTPNPDMVEAARYLYDRKFGEGAEDLQNDAHLEDLQYTA